MARTASGSRFGGHEGVPGGNETMGTQRVLTFIVDQNKDLPFSSSNGLVIALPSLQIARPLDEVGDGDSGEIQAWPEQG
jgi:hypothetical protein